MEAMVLDIWDSMQDKTDMVFAVTEQESSGEYKQMQRTSPHSVVRVQRVVEILKKGIKPRLR